jgi:FkbM family methyltransferase
MKSTQILKKGVQTTLSSFGYNLIRTDWMKRLLDPAGAWRAAVLRHHKIATVIDVGANLGQYGSELRAWNYQGRIISFEPTSLAFKALSERTAHDRSWIAFNFALGEGDGMAEINVASNSGQSSSFLPMLDSHRQSAPEIRYVTTERISIKTLDGALTGLIGPDERLMLKLDVQGFEEFVLKGATATLPQVRLIECELSVVQLYEGQMLLPQMLAFLDELGFMPIHFSPAFSDPISGHCLQIDGTFARAQSPVTISE